jgi:acetyl-CoA carboxylase biotin carboxyl carrier protein
MPLTDEDVRAILHLLDASTFNELQLETETFQLSLRRAESGGWTEETGALRPPAALAPATPGTTVAAVALVTAKASSNTDNAGLVEVRTPLLGTFYRSPKPGAAPFVEVGGHVEADTVIAIVETMKLMNSVCAGIRGTIVEICLADAQFAEQEAVLMRIRPDAP